VLFMASLIVRMSDVPSTTANFYWLRWGFSNFSARGGLKLPSSWSLSQVVRITDVNYCLTS
jgi:hypothetical protein